MQKLREYLKGRNKGEFAKVIGIHPGSLSRILGGEYRPGYKLAEKIEAATDGAVPIQSWKREAADTDRAVNPGFSSPTPPGRAP
jgi:transcriptional regulator with XRE-family HTH domain